MKKIITSTEIKTVNKNFTKNKTTWPDGFLGKFYSMFREELISQILLREFGGRETSKFILGGHHHPDTKTRQRYHQKKKI